MGMTVWVNFRDDEKHESDGNDHSAVGDCAEQLDAIAERLSVKPLSSFFDDTDVRYNMDESGELEVSEDGWPASAAKWYSAAEGLKSVTTLLTYLKSNPAALKKQDGWSQADVIADLESCQDTLSPAAQQGKPFHLLLVM